MRNSTSLAVYAADERALPRARRLAAKLGLPLATASNNRYGLLLTVTEQRLELRECGPHAAGPVFADFLPGSRAFRRSQVPPSKAALARAAGLPKLQGAPILDATAGLGQDAFAFARWGSPVELIERSPVVGFLLADAIKRAGHHPDTQDAAANMSLTVGDARSVLETAGSGGPDVVYLDPMYPHSGKSAKKRKELRVLRLLLGDDEGGAELLAAALAAARRRVVVKRPRNAPILGRARPDLSLKGTTTRFDVYLVG